MYIPKNVHIKRQSSKIGQHSIKIYYFFTDENKCMYIHCIHVHRSKISLSKQSFNLHNLKV